MKLKGGCYCGVVSFEVSTRTPYPYMRCYCNYCRKTSGSGGFGINIMAEADTLVLSGEEHLGSHHGFYHDADTDELKESPGLRHFCHQCGSPLWAADPRWPQWIYPFASAIQTALPIPPETFHIMLDFKPLWVEVQHGEGNVHFGRYPDESIEDWHKRHGLYDEAG